MSNQRACAAGHVWPETADGPQGRCPTCGQPALAARVHVSPTLEASMAAAAITPPTGDVAATIDQPAPVDLHATERVTVDQTAPPDPSAATVLQEPAAERRDQPPAPPPKREFASKAVPGFEILDVLGHGGMGVVYKARDVQLNRTVALKMILAGAHASERQRARFHLEAEAVASLQHPNVVQVHQIGEHEDCPYFALEFVDGGSLEDKLKRGPLKVDEAAALVETLALAVHAAHQRGIVHRDLKPGNVLLTAAGIPKIADFGLAKRLEESPDTRTGAVLGTPSYMAPEQAGGKPSDVGPAADVYALGSILYELLAGKPPFAGPNPLAIIQQLHFKDPPPPSRLNPRVPRDLETICLKCLHKDRHRRYATAEALAEDLRRYRQHEPIAARPAGRVERLAKWVRRQPALAALILLVCLAVVFVTGGSLWYANRERYFREQAEMQQEVEKRLTILANEQRERARNNLRKAQQAVNEMLVAVGQQDMAYEPRMEMKRRNLLAKAVDFYQDFLKENGDLPELRDEAALAHKGLADVRRLQGDAAGARASYEEALRHLRDLVRADPTAKRRNLLAETCFGLGWLALRDEHQPDLARPAYAEALALWEALLAESGGRDDYLQGKARTHNELGLLQARAGQYPEALAEYRQALGLQRDLAKRDHENAGYREQLAGTLNDLGLLLIDQHGDLDHAQGYFLEAIEQFRLLRGQDQQNADYAYKLAATSNNLGNLRALRRQWPEADRAYDDSLDALRPLVDGYPRTPSFRMELAKAYRGKGKVAFEDGRGEAARAWWQQELDTLNQVEAYLQDGEQPRLNADLQSNLGWVLGNLGYYYKETGKTDAACAHLRQAVEHLRAAVQADPRNARFREGLGLQLQNLADAHLLRHEPEPALAAARELVAVFPGNAQALFFAACYAARGLNDWPDAMGAAASRKQALEWLRAARTLNPAIDLASKYLDNLKDDPAYQALRKAPPGS